MAKPCNVTPVQLYTVIGKYIMTGTGLFSVNACTARVDYSLIENSAVYLLSFLYQS